MPQVSAYLSEENGLPTSDDTPKFDNSKVETWSLFLPSSIPKDNRSPCHKGVIETERILRLAQLQDSLGNLRQFRRSLRNLRLYFKTNTAGEGQKTQTKSRSVETGVNGRIKRAVRRYRVAYRALSELDPSGDWTKEYHELRDEDNRGPLKEIEESGPGDGRYVPSWIWTSPSAMVLPSEGSAAERRELDETARHEWMTCRARADRWMEEEDLLQEEMRRVIVYLDWKSRTWSEKIGIRAGSCTPDVQHGVDAYARKQANIHREVAMSCARQWLPYLDACGFDTKWAEAFPWISPSRKAKLPKRFSVIPASTSPTLPATDSSPGTEGPGNGQKIPGISEKPSEDGNREGESESSNRKREGESSDREGEGESSNREGKGYSRELDEDEDCSDEGEIYSDEDEDYSDEEGADFDGVETGDELDFDYDDEYMS